MGGFPGKCVRTASRCGSFQEEEKPWTLLPSRSGLHPDLSSPLSWPVWRHQSFCFLIRSLHMASWPLSPLSNQDPSVSPSLYWLAHSCCTLGSWERTSPVVQWLRIQLTMQVHGFDPWSGISTCPRAAMPVYQDYWSPRSRNRALQREAPITRSLSTASREQPPPAATRQSPQQQWRLSMAKK